MTAARLILALAIVGPTAPVAMAAKKPPVEVANVRFQVNEGFGDEGGHRYVTVMFDATFNAKPPPGHLLGVKATCKVDGRTLVSSSDVHDTLADADAGLTKPGLYANPFISEPLPAVPSSCEFTISFGKMFDSKAKPLGQWCWSSGAVAVGRCRAP